MEPDDFRACLISMGYDLVSNLDLSRSLISATLLHMDHLVCPPTFMYVLSFPAHHTHWG